MIFERKIMRKIYGRTRTEDGYWRIKSKKSNPTTDLVALGVSGRLRLQNF
jgi:hypothetical protein